jgi:hypothetical protein
MGVLVQERAEVQHDKLFTFAEGQSLFSIDFQGPAAFFRMTEDGGLVAFHAISVEFDKKRETL